MDNENDIKINAELLAKYLMADPELKAEILETVSKDAGVPLNKAELTLKAALKILQNTVDESTHSN